MSNDATNQTTDLMTPPYEVTANLPSGFAFLSFAADAWEFVEAVDALLRTTGRPQLDECEKRSVACAFRRGERPDTARNRVLRTRRRLVT